MNSNRENENKILIAVVGILGLIVVGLLIWNSVSPVREESAQVADSSTGDASFNEEVNESRDENSESTDAEPSEYGDAQNNADSSVIIFHNGSGPMCIEALEFFSQEEIEYEEYLTTQEGFNQKLREYKDKFDGKSVGVSDSFGYYPIIIVDNKAFSGFDEDVKQQLLKELE
jgi:cytoskeletal protein RodZ